MIYCPTCNTANREGSKFCNECGTDLQKASLLRCPNCGDMNPSSRAECANCGARLVAQGGPEPEAALAEEAAPAPADRRAAEPPRDAEVPVWLRDLRSGSPPAGASEPSATLTEPERPAEPTPAHELPAWLSELRTPDTVQTDAPQSVAPASAAESSHAQSAGAAAPMPEPPGAQPTAGEDVPAWLHEFQPPPVAAPAAPEPAAPVARAATQPSDDAALPDWLKAFHSGGARTTDMPPPAETAAPIAGEPAPADSRMPQADAHPSVELPDWLKELAPAPAAPAAERSTDEVAREEPPDWLKPAAPPAQSGAPAAQPVVPTGPGELVPGEIPAWLQALRPGAIETLSGAVVETSGLLAGVRGALPVEPVLTRGHQSEPVEAVRTSVPVGGFVELLAPQSPPPPPTVSNRQVRGTSFRASWLAGFVLLLFVLAMLPFIVPLLPIPALQELWQGQRGAGITVHQPAADYYQTIEALRPNQIVMVAFDYTGGSRAELDPQARATLLHLFQNKQHILALSFVPEGGMIANDVLAGLNPANTTFAYPYSYGDTHLNLGYQSSGDAALRNLTQSAFQFGPNDFSGKALNSWPLTKNLKSINDLALLIELSDDTGETKRWVEQVERPSGKPLLAGVSAAAGPEARPYYDSKQLGGLLEGVRGSAEYEVLLSHPSTATSLQEAISYVVIALVAIVVLGILIALFRRRSAT